MKTCDPKAGNRDGTCRRQFLVPLPLYHPVFTMGDKMETGQKLLSTNTIRVTDGCFIC